MNNFLAQCSTLLGDGYVITDENAMLVYLQDWRGRKTGRALAVLKPSNAKEIAAIVGLCKTAGITIVPQGGNTGLVWGGIPDQSENQIVLSLTRLQQIRQIDVIGNTIEVEAGCILQHVQEAAEKAERLFPLSLAAEGSCTIGGNLSTNAGGTAVLRYGNMRELCLGLEVVTANGDIWNGLRTLRKDNTGYDLRDLFIGAEGTLGIITAAILKLFPRPTTTLTALIGFSSLSAVLEFFTLTQITWASQLTAFELMSHLCISLVTEYFPQLQLPPTQYPYFVLLELSSIGPQSSINTLFENWLSQLLENEKIQQAIIATSIAQANHFWAMREHIPLAQRQDGKNIKHDISLPIAQIAQFIESTNTILLQHFPQCRIIVFGHVGDGNLHYNVAAAKGQSDQDFLTHQVAINRIVHDQVDRLGGSISAEHGIGVLKRAELARYKSPIELNLMRQIKHAFDPHNLMNPGKIL